MIQAVQRLPVKCVEYMGLVWAEEETIPIHYTHHPAIMSSFSPVS